MLRFVEYGLNRLRLMNEQVKVTAIRFRTVWEKEDVKI